MSIIIIQKGKILKVKIQETISLSLTNNKELCTVYSGTNNYFHHLKAFSTERFLDAACFHSQKHFTSKMWNPYRRKVVSRKWKSLLFYHVSDVAYVMLNKIKLRQSPINAKRSCRKFCKTDSNFNSKIFQILWQTKR